MGLGESKKASRESQLDFKSVRASRQSSELSIKSERFVSPPTSPIAGFHSFAVASVGGTQPANNTKPLVFKETSVDSQPTAVNQKTSFASATELEKRLNQSQGERPLCNSNGFPTSATSAQQLQQGKHQPMPMGQTQKQEQQFALQQRQQQKLQQLQHISQNRLQQQQQQQQKQEQQQTSLLLQQQQSHNRTLQQKQQQHQCAPRPQLQQVQQQQQLQQPQEQSQKLRQQQQQTAQQRQLQHCQQKQSHKHPVLQDQPDGAKAANQQQPKQKWEPQKPESLQPVQPPQIQVQAQPSQKRSQHHQHQHSQQQFQPQQPKQGILQSEQPNLQQTQRHGCSAQDEVQKSGQCQPRLQDKEMQKLSTQSSEQRVKQQVQEHATQREPELQPKQPPQHQKENEAQKQCSEENRGKVKQQAPNLDALDTLQHREHKHNVLQGQPENQPIEQTQQVEIQSQSQKVMPPPSKKHPQLAQVAHEAQQSQQQQQHDQGPNHISKKTKKQLRREQRLRASHAKQFGRNTAQQDGQTQQQQHREQTEHAAKQAQESQPQLNHQMQLQSKGPKDQETLKVQPEDQKQAFMGRQTKPKQLAQQNQVHENQHQLQQIMTDGATNKYDQDRQTQQGHFADTNGQQEGSLKMDLALPDKSKHGKKLTAQNDCVLHGKLGKPLPLMTLKFTDQRPIVPDPPLQPRREFAVPAGLRKQKNQNESLCETDADAKPQTLQSTPQSSTSSQVNIQSNKETVLNGLSKETAKYQQTTPAPRKKTPKPATNLKCQHVPGQVDSQQSSGQSDHLEPDKFNVQGLKEQGESQQQQTPHHQQQMKQKQLNEEQRLQKLKQSQPPRQQKEEKQQHLSAESASHGVSKGREKLKPVRALQPHPPAFAASAAALQAQLSGRAPTQPTHTARKHKSVAGDATMEMFKTLQAQDSTAAAQTNPNGPGAQARPSVASWAVVCDKMPDQDSPSPPSTDGTTKKERREGQGFFSRIFGRKPKAESTTAKHSSSLEELSADMQALKIDSASSTHEMESPVDLDTDQTLSDANRPPPSSAEDDEGSSSAESDECSDPQPPSCMEAWEIADDVVEKALCLLPIQVGTVHSRRFTLPDCPFEPELVQRLVLDALEAKRGLKRIKEDQTLMTTFRDCLLKFFEGKEVTDVLPPCNHPPGSNQCSMQPVIQPLVTIIRHVLRGEKTASEERKRAAQRPTQNRRRQTEHGEPRPRRFIRIKRRLTAEKGVKNPTKLLIRFCNACADTRQPNGQPLFSCGRCRDAVYCSRECQNVDWITHKFTCPGGDRNSYCKHHGT